MPDIFLSYSREDLSTARRFAEGFERAGLDVWWDQTLQPGDAFDHLTEKALRESKVVVVLWSKHSVASRWVRAEATLAERNKTLVPVTIEACERPIMFELTQTSDLTRWRGDDGDASWQGFLASVRRMVGRDQSTRPAAPELSTAHLAHAPKPRPGRILAAVLAMLALILAGGIYLSKRTPTPMPAAEVQAKPRIAIMPFENLSPDPANAFFADGLHEEILSALSNSAAGLEVISRTTMMTYRAAPRSVAQIVRELGARYVLEGSVRRDGNDVRLTLQLIDARTDVHIWAQNFDRKLVKAMTLQSEVATAVASQLAVKLSAPAGLPVAVPTRDPAAYDLYLQARLASRQINGLTTAGEMSRIADLYAAAIARDTDFGLAHLGRVALGPTHLERPGGLDAWLQQTRLDLTAARRVLGNDPRIELFEGFSASSGLSADHNANVLRLFDKAEAQGLNDPDVLSAKIGAFTEAGRMNEALALAQRLVSLDPANPRLLLQWTSILIQMRQPLEAVHAADRYLEQVPADTRKFWFGLRGFIEYSYTGDISKLALPDLGDIPPGQDPGVARANLLRNLRFMRRYADIETTLKREPGPLLGGGTQFELTGLGVPAPAVASARGWARLLQGNKASARADGQEILKLLAQIPAGAVSEELTWLIRIREAEGYLFAGDPQKAVEAVHAGLALVPRAPNAVPAAYAAATGAGVLAWAGQEDEAAALLEKLSIAIPGLSPASITRDPVYADALAHNARYKSLSERLEAQMAATKLP